MCCDVISISILNQIFTLWAAMRLRSLSPTEQTLLNYSQSWLVCKRIPTLWAIENTLYIQVLSTPHSADNHFDFHCLSFPILGNFAATLVCQSPLHSSPLLSLEFQRFLFPTEHFCETSDYPDPLSSSSSALDQPRPPTPTSRPLTDLINTNLIRLRR